MLDLSKYEPLGDRAGARCKRCGKLIPYQEIVEWSHHGKPEHVCADRKAKRGTG